MINEFKAFINKGNVLDLAVAVIMAAAFGAVVASFVNDILMQIIAALIGQPDFSGLYSLFQSRQWGHQIWSLHQCGNQLHFCGLCGLPGHQSLQPDAQADTRRDHHKRVPLLPLYHSPGRNPLPQLHF